MPSGSFWQVNVKCPYYKHDNGRDRITCEGLVPGASTQSAFLRKQDFIQQIETFCCEYYWRCEICTALDEKYEEE